jgi:transcriptional regulator with XRE-family HTH domain
MPMPIRASTAIVDPVIADLRRRRVLCKMSQRELAEAAGMTQSSISEIEAGIVNPTIDTVRRIADALDVDILVARGRGRGWG